MINLYSDIVNIYDEIYKSIYKIRKLSSSRTSIKQIFLDLMVAFIYVRKQGFFKKNIY